MSLKISIIGAGKMGRALHEQLSKNHEVELCERGQVPQHEWLILAVKPQDAPACIDGLKNTLNVDLSKRTVISIMAALDLAKLQELTGSSRVVRSLPNLPLKVGKGFTIWMASPAFHETEKAQIQSLFECFGEALELHDEALFDPIGVLSGCSPAFFFYLTELLELQGQAWGLKPEQAQGLARTVFLGAAALLEASPDQSAANLREAVSSKGGVTLAALERMQADGFPKAFLNGLQAAVDRSKVLAGGSAQPSKSPELSFASVRNAQRQAELLSDEQRNEVLLDLAQELIQSTESILSANQQDLAAMEPTDPRYDRLLLNAERITGIASELRQVASLPSPLGLILEERTLSSGIQLKKISVPLGVIGMIYEARPNVSVDVFSLCYKSGNAAVLKGGKEAKYSNEALIAVIHRVLERHKLPKDLVFLMPSDRSSVDRLLKARGEIDVLIPRGGQALIDLVVENAKIPVIETGAGIVHVFVDSSADLVKARDILTNSKARRVSVCNALDTLLIHQDRLEDLPGMLQTLAGKNCELYADERSFAALLNAYPSHLLFPAQEQDFGQEFLAMKLAVKTVDSLEEALEHIEKYSSKHSEAIVSENPEHIQSFFQRVDAACLYANASTAFTDGAQFGLGAEIGISTQKLHARGPMALREMTTYKWLLKGGGEVRG